MEPDDVVDCSDEPKLTDEEWQYVFAMASAETAEDAD